jgi:histidyl-tRNA synthetase
MPIKPKLPGGFRDYLPEDQIERNKMLEKIKGVFENFGFNPLDTPAVENKEILTGGDPNFNKQIFEVSNADDSNSEKIALRFDLTVPLARVVSAYPEIIKKPAKLYRFGRVWRGERQQAGRYKEFLQCDADTVGSSSLISDAEIIAADYQIMKNLNVGKFLISISNRKILNGLAELINIEKDKISEVFRAIDKLPKQGWDKVEENLKEADLDNTQVLKIKEFVSIKDGNKIKLCEEAEKFLPDSKTGQEGIKELKELVNILETMGIPSEAFEIDFSIVRGLGYYTGMVFETFLTDIPELGSVASGGRYDSLIDNFSGSFVPAVGFSVGFDRLYQGIKEVDSIESEKSVSKIMVLNFDPSAEEEVVKIVTDLRNNNISAVLYLGNDNTLKGQLSYAVSEDMRGVIIVGEKELEKEVVVLKNTLTKQQEEVSKEELVEKVKEIL